jgi:hypothetical protein
MKNPAHYYTRAFIIAACILIVLTALPSFAQVSIGGTPSSRYSPLKHTLPTVSMPPADVQAYILEDEAAPKDVPYRFGVPFEVALNLGNSGTWTTEANGDRIWRLRIESAGAYSINLLYDQFYMPDGARLFIYNDNYEYVIGAFTSQNNKADGTFATQPVPGDALTLEYTEPEAVAGQGVISIMRVVHAYRNLFGYATALDDFNESGNCNNNVNCPEGDPWQSEKRGVAMILMSGGSRICTGSLVNNTAEDGTPFFLTANHCLGGENFWIFMFNYESPSCTNVDGPTNQTVSNATLLFHNANSDGALLEISELIPEAYFPYYNGWNAVDSASTSSVSIHHPSGDIKKITFDDDASISSGWLGAGNSHWKIANWEDGTTEGGSSGSPLFDQNHRVTGQLHGGTASCNNNINDYFGKFALSWTSGLSEYLDPLGTGVLILDGYDPNIAGRVAGVVTDAALQTPLTDVLVQVIDGARSTVTDENGEYEIPLADGTFSLLFSKFGYQDYTESNIVITEGAEITRNVAMTSVPSGLLTGRITAGLSVPVQDAEVTIGDVPLPSVFSDANGNFEFNLPGNSSYNVHVSFGDAAFDSSVFVPINGEVEILVYLASARSQVETGDEYGYTAQEIYDFGIPPVYDWVEIAPAQGGPGSVVSLEGPDFSAFVPLDEPFVFYGLPYDVLTVNENGWIAPGSSMNQRNSNTPIPNPSGPMGMLAVYWDNLHYGEDSQICWWYDDEHCRLIIEYYNMHFLPEMDSILTCQVQIYSATSWPVTTGDSEIKYLYKHIGIRNSSTVGIENQAQSDGIQVLFNGTYGAHSWPVTEGTAILFTTRTAERATGTLSGSIVAHPDEVDFLNAQFYFNCESVQSNPVGSFTTANAFVGNQMVRVELPGYETWELPATISASTPASVEFELWRLDPPRNLVVWDELEDIQMVWDDPLSLSEGNDHFVEYIIFRNGEEYDRTDGNGFTDPSFEQNVRYEYWIKTVYEGGVSDTSNHSWIILDTDENTNALPTEFALSPPYPNPFNATTTIDFALPRASDVSLSIFDILGREVATITSGHFEAGNHSVMWNAADNATGVYIVRMEAESYRAVQKVLLLK